MNKYDENNNICEGTLAHIHIILKSMVNLQYTDLCTNLKKANK